MKILMARSPHPSSVTGYVQSVSYWPHGGIGRIKLGNGLYEETCYDAPRLHPVAIRLGNTFTENEYGNPSCADAGADALHLVFTYGAAGADNGNVTGAGITARPPGAAVVSASQGFIYDQVNRLLTSNETGAWARNYGYDAYGNGWVTTNTGVSLDPNTPQGAAAYDAQNRLHVNGASYDNAGNQTAIAGFTNVYDAENRLWTSTLNGVTTTYTYDGDGRRVQKATQGGATTVYVYDAAGQLAAEYGTASPEPCTTCYLTADHLGSTRAVTNQDGVLKALHDYLPFGEEIPSGVGNRSSLYGGDLPKQKFTGKERDVETGLDFFGARYMSSTQGRFTTPDDPLVDQWADDPQSWNLYSYARNNPLKLIDPTGNAVCRYDDGSEDWRDEDGATAGACADEGGTWVLQPKDLNPGWDAQSFWFSTTRTENTGDLPDDARETLVLAGQKAGPVADPRFIAQFYGASIVGGAAGVGLSTLAGGAGLTVLNLQGAAEAAGLLLPAGAKVAQMMQRTGASSPSELLSMGQEMVTTATQQGTVVYANWINGSGAYIYRVGNNFLVVARAGGRMLSYVVNATPGQGVAATYDQLGGK
jgi:RHS repeat-associated protein